MHTLTHSLTHACISTYTASYQLIFEPTARVSLDTYITSQNYLILSLLNNVKSQLFFWKYGEISENWIFMGNESTGSIRGTFIR